jgi:hypothetical protein
MASIDRTAYPRLPKQLSDEELEAQFGPADEEAALTFKESIGDNARLTFLVMLKTRQQLGYFPLLGEVPEQITVFLAAALSLPPDTALLDARSRPRPCSVTAVLSAPTWGRALTVMLANGCLNRSSATRH